MIIILVFSYWEVYWQYWPQKLYTNFSLFFPVISGLYVYTRISIYSKKLSSATFFTHSMYMFPSLLLIPYLVFFFVVSILSNLASRYSRVSFTIKPCTSNHKISCIYGLFPCFTYVTIFLNVIAAYDNFYRCRKENCKNESICFAMPFCLSAYSDLIIAEHIFFKLYVGEFH
jgi:hypothetical protein